MLSSKNRASRKDIEKIGRKNTIRTKHILFSWKTSPDSVSRLSCSVSKKVAKLAVDRNKLKRDCRHALREVVPKIKKPIVGIARILDSSASSSDFKKEGIEILKKLK